ncbi:DUF983 domain-containing protein [Fertoebacter nigrum]|uniref:DUF983 domain-containing protein n=1 Tax=Fertoeibacter niger TaxID=2656921 RepID=A0A8X8KLP2_9RHOB|nr:DUF983 domain-containing protein [Fertoeibacter niger]NUB45514.1 DUF983 domain-containing protein [Fertoeibacter niger]
MQATQRLRKPAIRNGLRCRCPDCGTGRLFSHYLKVAAACDTCGQSFAAQKADDGPAYFTILIMCHVSGFLLHALAVHTDLGPAETALLTSVVAVSGSLLLLPRIKGAMIGWQWAERLHGF